MRETLSKAYIDDLLVMFPGRGVHLITKRARVTLKRLDEATQAYYGMRFIDKRQQLREADVKAKGRNNFRRANVGSFAIGSRSDGCNHSRRRHRSRYTKLA